MAPIPTDGGPEMKLCYVRLGLREPAAAAAFASDILGLQPVPNDLGCHLFRSDQRAHTLCLSDDSEPVVIGIELLTDELEPIGDAIRAAGFEVKVASDDNCHRRAVRQALLVKDASGNAIDLVSRPSVSGRRYFTQPRCRCDRVAGCWATQPQRGGGSEAVDGDPRRPRERLGWRRGLHQARRKASSHRAVPVRPRRAGLCRLRGRELRRDHAEPLFRPGAADQDTARPRPRAGFRPDVRADRGAEGQLFSYGYGMNDITARHRCRQFSPVPLSLCEWGSDGSEIPEFRRLVG
uniref:PsbC1 n=1 Tax=Rhodopseudomonas palustris TaxID=1076 RepID=Q9XDW1_RHOPL|nr:PsbC1 [Rhodopseudomonas palustris]